MSGVPLSDETWSVEIGRKISCTGFTHADEVTVFMSLVGQVRR